MDIIEWTDITFGPLGKIPNASLSQRDVKCVNIAGTYGSF